MSLIGLFDASNTCIVMSSRYARIAIEMQHMVDDEPGVCAQCMLNHDAGVSYMCVYIGSIHHASQQPLSPKNQKACSGEAREWWAGGDSLHHDHYQEKNKRHRPPHCPSARRLWRATRGDTPAASRFPLTCFPVSENLPVSGETPFPPFPRRTKKAATSLRRTMFGIGRLQPAMLVADLHWTAHMGTVSRRYTRIRHATAAEETAVRSDRKISPALRAARQRVLAQACIPCCGWRRLHKSALRLEQMQSERYVRNHLV